MSTLRLVLPPFAPDYSGVCACLFSLGDQALTVIHDGAGCTGNYTGHDEPRWFHSKSPILCSGLREIDAIMGDDETLVKKILYAASRIKPKLINLIGSPVPMVIGTDLEGIASERETISGIHTIGFPTNGLALYLDGIRMLYRKLVISALSESDSGSRTALSSKLPSVNLLGATPLDFHGLPVIPELQSLFSAAGYHVNTLLWQEYSQDDILSIPDAVCNISISSAADELSAFLERTYGIPTLYGFPITLPVPEQFLCSHAEEDTERQRFLQVFDQVILEKKSLHLPVAVNRPAGTCKHALILGERITCESIAAAIAPHNITSDFCTVDRIVKDEGPAEDLLNSGKYDLVIGDPLYKGLLHAELPFISLPHFALSGGVLEP